MSFVASNSQILGQLASVGWAESPAKPIEVLPKIDYKDQNGF
jgi:hypothetical protein